jgi:UDP-2,3-diacylglucosamine pyrophosphatase LpxH
VHLIPGRSSCVQAHQAIFDQLRATRARIKVTMMVGNHDYDLACDPAFVEKLQAYNIHLDPSLVLIRPVGDKRIWIEHGQQRDQFSPGGLLHHGNLRQRSQPVFRLRLGRLAQGHPLRKFALDVFC